MWSARLPGDAAGLKLLRSVFMKGMAAAAIESLEAARAAGVEDRVRADIAAVIGEPRCSSACCPAHRRTRRAACDEMHAAAAYVDELGIEPSHRGRRLRRGSHSFATASLADIEKLLEGGEDDGEEAADPG